MTEAIIETIQYSIPAIIMIVGLVYILQKHLDGD